MEDRRRFGLETYGFLFSMEARIAFAGYSARKGLVFAGEKWLVFRLDLQQVSRLLLVLPNIVRK